MLGLNPIISRKCAFSFTSEFASSALYCQSVRCIHLDASINQLHEIAANLFRQIKARTSETIFASCLWSFHGQKRLRLNCHVKAKLTRNTCRQWFIDYTCTYECHTNIFYFFFCFKNLFCFVLHNDKWIASPFQSHFYFCVREMKNVTAIKMRLKVYLNHFQFFFDIKMLTILNWTRQGLCRFQIGYVPTNKVNSNRMS